MVTTNRLIPIDAFGSEPSGLVHLTGSFQVLARVTMGGSDGTPARVELLLDAAQVRGVGLEHGTRYQARGAYRCINDPGEPPISFELVSTFELLGYARVSHQKTRLLMVVPLRVTVEVDGKIAAHIDDPKLLPCP